MRLFEKYFIGEWNETTRLVNDKEMQLSQLYSCCYDEDEVIEVLETMGDL